MKPRLVRLSILLGIALGILAIAALSGPSGKKRNILSFGDDIELS